MLMSLISKIVALICAYTFTPFLSELIKAKYIMKPISGSIADTIKSLAPVSNGQYDLVSLFSDMPQTLASILERYNINTSVVIDTVNKIGAGGDNAVSAVSDLIAQPIVDMISVCIAFIVIFLAVCILLAIVTLIIGSVFELPVLKQANTLLGFLLGLCTALLILFIYSSAVSSIVTALGSVAPQYFGNDVVEQTLLVRLFSNYDLLSLVNKILS